jgi:pyruvate/2-oxoglutarate dehydrogenase complex dihydrolipoamide acyltransferase (E2) component
MKRYRIKKEIKSLARGGVSLSASSPPVLEHSFTPDHLARLVKDGALELIEDEAVTAVFDNSEANATKSAIELADKHGLELWSVNGTGNGGRITLGDVKALVENDDA